MDSRRDTSAPWSRLIAPHVLAADVAVLSAVLALAPGVLSGAAALGVASGVVVCLLNDSYRTRLRPAVRRDLPGLVVASLVAAGTASVSWEGLVASLTATPAAVLLLGAAVLLSWTAARALVYAAAGRVRAGRDRRPVIVVGTGPTAVRLVEGLRRGRDVGLDPVGMVHHGDPDAAQTQASARLPVPFLGGITTVTWAMLDLGVHEIAFAVPGGPDPRVVTEVNRCLRNGERVLLSVEQLEVSRSQRRRAGLRIDDVELIEMSAWGLPTWQRLLRRCVDVVASLVALVALSPLLLVMAVALRIETRSSSWQHSTRTSRRGATYARHTFRTLRAPVFTAGSTVWRIDNSSRTGALGSLVRRGRLDDLPRLVNVLVGDESLFGRPADRPRFVGETADQAEQAAPVNDRAGYRPDADTPVRAPAPK